MWKTLSICVLASVSRVSAQETHDPSNDQLAERAVELLLEKSERYRPDRQVGRMSEERLGTWQAKERERLEELHEDAQGLGDEWPYEGVYRVSPDGRIPGGYRVGGTAIVAEGLLEYPGLRKHEEQLKAVRAAAAFIIRMLDEDPSMAPGPKRGYDVRGWGHTYALSFLLRALEHGVLAPEVAQQAREAVEFLLNCLKVNEVEDGGWNYASNANASPFQTGATLLALYRAQAAGFEVPHGLVPRGLEALERGRRKDTGAWSYSVRPGQRSHREKMHASSARAAIAELALHHAGLSTPKDLRRAVDGFFDGWEHLLKRKSQQGTHVGPYSIAPYYFYFGHGYVAHAIEALPEKQRPELRAQLRKVLLVTRDEDGSWNDRIFPRTSAYCTAMVLMALRAPDLPRFPDWQESKSKGEGLKKAGGR